MTLRVPIFKMHNVAATERTWPVSCRRFLARGVPEKFLPFFLSSEPVSVHVSVTSLMPHQFHEPLRRLPLHLKHHRSLQRAQPVVHKKERNKNCRNTDGHKPFIAD